METLYKYLGIGAIVLGIFCAFFFGFKCKQASGSARLNEFETDFGGGSFSTSIKSGFMQFFGVAWFLFLCLVLCWVLDH